MRQDGQTSILFFRFVVVDIHFLWGIRIVFINFDVPHTNGVIVTPAKGQLIPGRCRTRTRFAFGRRFLPQDGGSNGISVTSQFQHGTTSLATAASSKASHRPTLQRRQIPHSQHTIVAATQNVLSIPKPGHRAHGQFRGTRFKGTQGRPNGDIADTNFSHVRTDGQQATVVAKGCRQRQVASRLDHAIGRHFGRRQIDIGRRRIPGVSRQVPGKGRNGVGAVQINPGTSHDGQGSVLLIFAGHGGSKENLLDNGGPFGGFQQEFARMGVFALRALVLMRSQTVRVHPVAGFVGVGFFVAAAASCGWLVRRVIVGGGVGSAESGCHGSCCGFGCLQLKRGLEDTGGASAGIGGDGHGSRHFD